MTLCGISSRFQLLSPSERQVAHALLTRSPLSCKIRNPKKTSNTAPFDLHVLGTPPAFVLSQDQTLNDWYYHSRSCYNLRDFALSKYSRNLRWLIVFRRWYNLFLDSKIHS